MKNLSAHKFRVLAVLSVAIAAAVSAQTIGFQRDAAVGVITLPKKDGQEPLFFDGLDSCVSPDGKWIAFTEMDANEGRFVAVGDASTGKKRRVSGIPGDNSYRPLWSPDGQTLTFDHYLKGDWVVGRVNMEGGEFRILEGIPKKVSSHAWSPDGKRLLCQDMESLFWVEVEDWNKPVVKEVPQPIKVEGLNSGTKLAISPDGMSALVTMEVPPEPGEEYPPTAIFLFDLGTGEFTRLSAKGIQVSDPSWLPDGKSYLFSLYGEESEIHMAEAKPGAVSKRMLGHAEQPSVAMGIR